MKKLLTTLLMITSIASAATVHYDQKKSEKNTVHYDNAKTKSSAISKANHPHNSLYKKK